MKYKEGELSKEAYIEMKDDRNNWKEFCDGGQQAKEEPMKRVLPIIIVILLIIGVGGGVVWSILAGRYKPTEEVIDYAAEMGLSENEYAITLNQEVLKEDRATFDKMFNEWYAQFVYFAYYFINDAEVRQ